MTRDWHKAQEKADLKIRCDISSALRVIYRLIDNDNISVEDLKELRGIEGRLIKLREKYTG